MLRYVALLSAITNVVAYVAHGPPRMGQPEVLYSVKGTVVSQKSLGNNMYDRRLETANIVQSEAIVRCNKTADKNAWCAYAGPSDLEQVYLRNTWQRLEHSLPKLPKDLLLLGFGAMIPAFILHNHPQVRITAVDIDPEAVDVASRFLGMPPLKPAPVATGDPDGSKRSCAGQLCVVIADAQAFIASQLAAPKSPVYDAAIVDIFGGDGDPPEFVKSTAFLGDLASLVRQSVLFTEDVDTLNRNQLAGFYQVWKTIEVSQFSSEDQVVLRREICPCQKAGDSCGCGDENRFVLVKDVLEQQRNLRSRR